MLHPSAAVSSQEQGQCVLKTWQVAQVMQDIISMLLPRPEGFEKYEL
jgi:hypothetical protein